MCVLVFKTYSLCVALTVGVGVGVFVGATVGVGVGVFVGVTVGVGVGVFVGATVGVGVGVFVGVTVGVGVGVFVEVIVSVGVNVLVGVTVGVDIGVLIGVTVSVGVGVLVEVIVSVGVDVLVGVTVSVGVGVSVRIIVGVKVGVFIGVIVVVILSVEDSSVVLLRLFLVLVELEVSSVEVVGIEKKLTKNIIVTIIPQSPFLGLNLFLILSQIGGHISKEHNKNNILFPKELTNTSAKRRNSANSIHFNNLKNFCSILLFVSFSSIIFSPV